MRLRVLGPIALHGPSGEPLSIGGARREVLLALLASEANRAIPADRLINLLWTELPREPAGALYNLVSRLRRTVAAAGMRVVSRPSGYLLEAATDHVDVLRLAALIRSTPPATAEPDRLAAAVRSVLDLSTGVPYAGFTHIPALRRAAEQLVEMRLSWLERAGARLLTAGEASVASHTLEAVVAAAPLREGAQAALLRARHAEGRTADAIAGYHTYRTVLAEDTGLDPGSAIHREYLRLLRQDAGTPAPGPVPARAGSPPVPRPLTPILGRDTQIDEIVGLLRRGHRMVTVTGPGGVGKTRLAVETAIRYGGAAGFLDLTAAQCPEDAAHLLAQVVPGDPRLLLVVDCAPAAPAAGDLFAAMLARCAGVQLLVASRERLGVVGETAYPLGALPVPAEGDGVPEILANPAVRLFLDRAAGSVAPEPEAAEAATLAEICRGVGGLPLALELAATVAHQRPLEKVLPAIAGQLGVACAEPPWNALESAISWSHQRLTARERTLLQHMAVFVTPFDEVAAAAVTGLAPGPLGRALDRLVSRGLLRRQEGPARRYAMPALLSGYLTAKLMAPEQVTEARMAHLRFHARLCAAPAWLDDALLAAVEDAYPDCLAGLWAGMELPAPARQVGDLGIALLFYWIWREQPQTALTWLTRLERRLAGAPEPLAKLATLRALVVRNSGDLSEATELIDRALRGLGPSGDPEWLVTGYAIRAAIADDLGDGAEVVRWTRAAVAAARQGAPRRLPEVQAMLAMAYCAVEEYGSAAAEAQCAMELLHKIRSPTLRAGTILNAAQALVEAGRPVIALELVASCADELANLPAGMVNLGLCEGWARLSIQDADRALAAFRRVLVSAAESNQDRWRAEALIGCACALAEAGQHREAALVLGGAEQLGYRLDIRLSPWLDRRRRLARERLIRVPDGADLIRAGAHLRLDTLAALAS